MDDEFEMPVVSSIVKLSGKYIGGTSGKDYDASVKEAYEMAKRKTADKNYPYTVVLVDYYKQIMGGKSILFSFNLLPKLESNNG